MKPEWYWKSSFRHRKVNLKKEALKLLEDQNLQEIVLKQKKTHYL